MSSYWWDASVEAALNAICTLLNGGSLKIYQGTQPSYNGSLSGGTLLATLTLNATFAGSATASSGTGTAAANSITSGTAGASGTAQYFVLEESGGSVVMDGTCGTSGADLNLSSTSITSGQTVSCSAFSMTMSETGT